MGSEDPWRGYMRYWIGIGKLTACISSPYPENVDIVQFINLLSLAVVALVRKVLFPLSEHIFQSYFTSEAPALS